MITNEDRVRNVRKMLEQVDPSGRFNEATVTLQSRASGRAAVAALDVRRTNPEALEASVAMESLDALRRDQPVDAEQRFVLEAIVMPLYRPVIDVIDDYIVKDQLTAKWEKLGRDLPQEWVTERTRAVGRINVPNILYAGTGFLVGNDLLMTNRHVAAFFAQGLGTRRVGFQTGQTAAIDFYHEKGKPTTESLTIEEVVMIHPWWDMALLRVSGVPANRLPLKLSAADPARLVDREVVVIGYPGYDPTGDQEFQRVQSRIFRDTYYVKRFQPGLFRVREEVDSYQKMVNAVTHDCSTLGGNSGSVVIDLQTGHVIGLHFAGSYLVANYAVSPFDLAQDHRVIDAGVPFEGPRPGSLGDFYGGIWARVDTRESALGMDSHATHTPLPAVPPPGQSITTGVSPVTTQTNSVSVTIPLHVSVSLGTPTLVAPPLSTVPSKLKLPSDGLVRRTAPPETVAPFTTNSLKVDRFDWHTALSLALASNLSYEGAVAVNTTAINVWGLQTCEFIEADDTQCFVASSAKAVLVAFRGTESLGDWLSNLNAISTTRSYGVVHRGFLGAFQVVAAQLRSVLSRFPDRQVFLTGHSLGGALATIAAAEWFGQVPVSWIYTYGQPGVGKGNFPSFIRQRYSGKFFRFVNDDDIVPRVPPTYLHVGQLFHFDAQGGLQNRIEALRFEGEASGLSPLLEIAQGPLMLTEAEFDLLRAQLLERRARLAGRGTESLEAAVPEGLFPSVSDHSLDQYIAKIAAQTRA